MRLFLPPAFLALLSTTLAALYHPTPQTYLLEHILVDNWGAYASNFSAAITPCTNYVTEVGPDAVNSGRTTAAQWMRVAFHDFVTANVSAGTGGIDASIGFETLREENKGSAMNDSFTFWRPFVNEQVSMADMVAMGTVMSMSLCGPKKTPFRPGRIDATQAGVTTGVPEPQSDLEETLALFARAGFNVPDSIKLTACGHTMGSVHHGGFPDVVPQSAVTSTDTNGGINFDSTRGAFDPLVVHEYIDWTGNRGGPLVTTDNETDRSDLRLYESDGNATMQALYDQGDGFQDTCVDIMGRMINTVPAGVTLGEPMEAIGVKPVNASFDLVDGRLVFAGKIRVLTAASNAPPTTLSVQLGKVKQTLSPESGTGSSTFGASGGNYGTTSYFPFSLANVDSRSTAFVVSGTDILSESFPVQSKTFVVPSLTTAAGSLVNATIATKLPGDASGYYDFKLAAPVPQQGTLGPKVVESSFDVALVDNQAGYALWQGSAQLGAAPTGLISVKVLKGSEVVDLLMVNPGTAGW